MNTWYRVRTYGLEITPVEVVKETTSYITTREKLSWNNEIKESRSLKNSSYERYFQTFEDAKNHVIGRLLLRIDTAEQQKQEAERELAKAKCLVKP